MEDLVVFVGPAVVVGVVPPSCGLTPGRHEAVGDAAVEFAVQCGECAFVGEKLCRNRLSIDKVGAGRLGECLDESCGHFEEWSLEQCESYGAFARIHLRKPPLALVEIFGLVDYFVKFINHRFFRDQARVPYPLAGSAVFVARAARRRKRKERNRPGDQVTHVQASHIQHDSDS
jgi:hypothetical protein